MSIDKELIDKLLEGYRKPEDIVGENGLLKQLTKAIVERAMEAEPTHHLGYRKRDAAGRENENKRNGAGRRRRKGDCGEIEIAVPRDRQGISSPQIVPNDERRRPPSRLFDEHAGARP